MNEKIIEYAPIIIVVLVFIWQNNVFVKPEQLEKKHREITDEIDKKLREFESSLQDRYVEVNAYKEFQGRVFSELSKVSTGITEIKDEMHEFKKIIMGQ